MTETTAASNKALIEKFYTAFGNGDAKTMQSCYHETIVFQDPAFGVLTGTNAGDMWELLLSGPRENKDGTKALKIEFSDVETTDTIGSAKWVAHYNFSSTGRPVVNKIQASFEFKDGLISKHTDVFDFWSWSSQALGFSGYALGWTSFLNNKVNKQANDKLTKFIAKKYAPAEPETAAEAAPAVETGAVAAPAAGAADPATGVAPVAEAPTPTPSSTETPAAAAAPAVVSEAVVSEEVAKEVAEDTVAEPSPAAESTETAPTATARG